MNTATHPTIDIDAWFLLLPTAQQRISVFFNTTKKLSDPFLSALQSEISDLIPASQYNIVELTCCNDSEYYQKICARNQANAYLLHSSSLSTANLDGLVLTDFKIILIPFSVLPGNGTADDYFSTQISIANSAIVSYKRMLDGTFTSIECSTENQIPKATSISGCWSDKEITTERELLPVESNLWKNANLFIAKVLDQFPLNSDIEKASSIWTAGITSWKKLVARGILVNGCTDSLGERLLNNSLLREIFSGEWVKLTHSEAIHSSDAMQSSKSFFYKVIPFYKVKIGPLPKDIENKTHFFWHSGSMLKSVASQYPSIIDGYHACGLGETFQTVSKIISRDHYQPFLNETQWRAELA